jgi:hypothetical protein
MFEAKRHEPRKPSEAAGSRAAHRAHVRFGVVSDIPGVSLVGALESEGVSVSAITGQDSAQPGQPSGPFRKYFSKDFKAT